MKKSEYNNIKKSCNRNKFIMFVQTLEEVLFYYSFESYKLPALNSHYLCYDLLRTKQNIEQKAITEGNFIPLSEEFENAIKHDMVLEKFLPAKEMLLGKRDKLKNYVDYTKFDYKAKINKYTEAAEYISEISDNVYLHTIYDVLIENIFSDNVNFEVLQRIYMATRILATELVNGGYSPEYISHELKHTFLDKRKTIAGSEQELIDFFNKFLFEKKSYQVIFGINAETSRILKQTKNITVKKPSKELKKDLGLKHNGDMLAELLVEDIDSYMAVEKAYSYINTVVGLHRISQHHRPIYIKGTAQISQVDDELNILSSSVIKNEKNVLLRANNESQIQSYFFDDQLLNNVNPPESFFRAVSLHNSALDSKEATNQLLDLWTAVETLVGFRTGDEDKINVVCNILTNILNRSYMYNQMEQLCKDILTVLGKQGQEFFDKIEENEQNPMKLAFILGLKAQEENYNELKDMLEEYPILQYRMELFSKHIFCNSKTVFEELMRHKEKLKWQIMRIYRNRNMIVHNGEHMPYLEIVLGNLHYYVDAMFDVLIEYYHMGIANNRIIFFDIEKEEILYWKNLGLDEKGKKVKEKEITQENYKKLLFNEYEGNSVKNVVKKAINEKKNKKNEKEE